MADIVIRHLGLTEWHQTYQQMICFTNKRTKGTKDELWVTEHYPIYTLGLSQRNYNLNINNSENIPVAHSDRGGKVTYHGPGQVLLYTLIDLYRRGISIKKWVYILEQITIDFLTTLELKPHRFSGRPGIYINKKKIAALGLRVRKGFCYHGLALNVEKDLHHFDCINPCGYTDMKVTSLNEYLCNKNSKKIDTDYCAQGLINELFRYLQENNY